jgi:hypothetical protein
MKLLLKERIKELEQKVIILETKERLGQEFMEKILAAVKLMNKKINDIDNLPEKTSEIDL